MKTTFPGFSREGMEFLRDLKENNRREWFTPRKQVFEEQLRLPLIELVRVLHGEMLRFAPRYVGEPAKCVFRIYRDTRFSKDKTPYKTHIAASFWPGALGKSNGAGYYFSLSPDEIEIAGGLYTPEPDILLAARQHIATDPAAFRATFDNAKTRRLMGDLRGETMSRPPKGFDPGHPAIDLLKRKQFCLIGSLAPEVAHTSRLAGEIVKRFETMAPFVDFLNAPLTARRKQAPLC